MKFLRIILVLWAGIASAQATGQELTQPFRLAESLAYRTMAEFSVYAIDEGDPRAEKRLNAVLAEGDKLTATLGNRWPLVAAEWNETRNFILEHREAAVMHDATLPPRLEARMKALYAAFQTDRPADAELPEDKLVLHKLLGSLEQMLASYLYFNINIFGGHAVKDTGIEQQSQQFEQLLSRVSNPALQQDLKRKWLFVKGTLLAYNERSAVYIVDRTGQSMRELLLQSLQQ